MGVRAFFLSAAVLLGSLATPANAVTVSAGDILRIDFTDLTSPPFDGNADSSTTAFFSGFAAGELATFSIYNNVGLVISTRTGGLTELFAGGAGVGQPPLYWLISDIVGSFDVTSAIWVQGNNRWEGTFTVSSVPIPAALPLLASGLGALGFIGWRRKRKAA